MEPADRRDRRETKQQQRTLRFLEQVTEALRELHRFWPVTLRQLYYSLVGKGWIPNSRNSYQRLSNHLTTARLQGSVPWEAIEDRVRETITSWGWSGASEFVKDQVLGFLWGYHRDLLQSQPLNIEILIEKDALSRVAAEVAGDYGIPVLVCRGNNSISKSKEFCDRARTHLEDGRETRILYFGDLDPSGVAMLPSVLHTMQVEMGLGEAVQGYFCALQPWHVDEYDLPRDPDAIKKSDSRTAGYLREYGNLSVELDALPPAILQQLIREAIEDHLNMGAYQAEVERDEQDRRRIAAFRDRVSDLLDAEPWEEEE
jgi:hypothetical protein